MIASRPRLNQRILLRITSWHIFCALTTYFMLSVLLTWPLILELDSTLFGDFGDTRGVIWGIWAKLNGYLDKTYNHLIAFPFGAPSESGISTPISEYLIYFIAKCSDEIVSYNIYILLSFPLTAISTYFLLNRLLSNKSAAYFGGLIFGFCPAAVMQVIGGHAAFAFNMFIPLFLLALINNRSQRTFLSAFYISISFAGTTLTAIYFGYFAIYIAIFFVAFDLINSRNNNRLDVLKGYLYAGFFALLLILPFEYKVIYQQLTFDSGTLAKSGQIRDFTELIAYSSRPWDFIIPSIDHPILGRFLENFVRTHLHGSNVPEQTLYLGLVPITLLLAGFVLVTKKKFDVINRNYFLFFSCCALWMFYLSLPPIISFGSISIPTASYFAYLVLPMFRVYARFGILVNFFIGCATAVVLAYLYQNMTRLRYFSMLLLLSLLLIFEYWSIPPNYALSIKNTPEVYQWLSKAPKDTIIAIYPMTPGDQYAFYTYLFWQRIHKKKLVNGATPSNERGWNFYQRIKNIEDPLTPELLKSIGVTHVVVHKKMYSEGPIPDPIKRYYSLSDSSITFNGGRVPTIPPSLRLLETFSDDLLFSLDSVQVKNF